MSEDGWGIYVHTPWCRVRCPYCAFYVEVDRDTPWEAFGAALLAEHAQRRAAWPGRPRSVFFGGGTPSRAPVDRLVSWIRALDAAPGAEIAVEANPEDLDAAWLSAALEGGVDRVSLGVQTFEPKLARLLNRAHKAQDGAEAARRLAHSSVRTWSLDLMFAVPGQTLEQLARDVAAAIELGAPHVSLYGLTWEPGTPFHRARALGRLRAADDELWRAMYDRAVADLEAAGLHRYEISNFARPGHESVHNTGYWTGAPYMGLGPAAHSFEPDGRRTANPRDVSAWMRDGAAAATIEQPTPEEQAADLLICGLRGARGMSLERLGARTGRVPDPARVATLVAEGLLARSGARIWLTAGGVYVCDAVTRHLIDGLGAWSGAPGDTTG